MRIERTKSEFLKERGIEQIDEFANKLCIRLGIPFEEFMGFDTEDMVI